MYALPWVRWTFKKHWHRSIHTMLSLWIRSIHYCLQNEKHFICFLIKTTCCSIKHICILLKNVLWKYPIKSCMDRNSKFYLHNITICEKEVHLRPPGTKKKIYGNICGAPLFIPISYTHFMYLIFLIYHRPGKVIQEVINSLLIPNNSDYMDE